MICLLYPDRGDKIYVKVIDRLVLEIDVSVNRGRHAAPAYQPHNHSRKYPITISRKATVRTGDTYMAYDLRKSHSCDLGVI